MESFRGDFAYPARLQVMAHACQNFGVTQNPCPIKCLGSFMLCVHACLTVMPPLDFHGKNCWLEPNHIIQIRHEWRSEFALWQSFYEAMA
jgi:hypothetical protein